jgi:hypothetical protein
MFTSKSVYRAASDVFYIKKDKDSQAEFFLAPCNGKTNDGMISFCKATKVDLDATYNSGNDGSDISPNDAIVSSTLLLISVLFESISDLDTTIDKGFLVPIQGIPLKDARTMITVPKLKCREKEGKKTFLLKPKYYTSKDLSPRHIDELQVYKAWCHFGQNEHLKNLICILKQICKRVYGKNVTIPKRLLNAFLLDTNEINKLVSRQADNTAKVFPYQYLTKLNGEDCVISGLAARLLQFPLGKIPTMSSILDKLGNSGEDINEDEYFKCSEGQREDVIMSTSKDFKECNIIYSMMKWIRVTNVKKIRKTTEYLNACSKLGVLWTLLKLTMNLCEQGTVICSRMMTMTFIR